MTKVPYRMSTTPPTLAKPTTDALRVEALLELARAGQIRVPRFQRPLRWTASDVEHLFDSIWRGYPIGSIFLWERDAPASEVDFGGVRFAAPKMSNAWFVVDGQQRVTSLVATLLATDEVDARFDLYFDLAEQRFRRRGSRTAPANWLPLRLVGDTNRLFDWLLEFKASGGTDEDVKRGSDVGVAIREYRVPIAVVRTDDERILRDVFDRMNAAGKALTRGDVFNALHASTEDEERHDLVTLAQHSAQLGFGELRRETPLFSMLAVAGGDVYRDFHREFADGDFEATYEDAIAGLERTIAFLRGVAGIAHVRVLPYSIVVPALVRLFHLHPELDERTTILLRRWVWRGAVAGLRDTPALRRAVQAIDGDIDATMARLLHLITEARPNASDRRTVQLSRATGRINLALLGSLDPRDLVTGELLDTSAVLDQDDAPLRIEISGRSTDIGGALFHPVIHDDAVVDAILAASPAVRASHAIDDEGVAVLAAEGVAGFVAHRARRLDTILANALDARTEWRQSDRPAIGHLVVDPMP